MPPVARTLGIVVLLVELASQAGAASGVSADWPEGALPAAYPAPNQPVPNSPNPAPLALSQSHPAVAPPGVPADANPVRQVSAIETPSAGVPLPPRATQPPVPLSSPGSPGRANGNDQSGLSAALTVAGSLAIVLGIFFLAAWGMRRAAPAGSTVLPGEVFEVLGRAPMAGRQQVQLLRWGNKLLLVSLTPAGAETLGEITDPAEVDRLAGLCRQAHPASATAAFRQVLAQFGATQPDDTHSRDTRTLAGPAGRERADV